nr:MAG TPA: hypothetical protein [Caudoviricetes sp.]
MKVHTNIYTSCYSKMLKRHKVEGRDVYVQVSRTLFYPMKGIDGKSIMEMIDLNYGPIFGMYSSLEQYEEEIKGEEYKEYLDELYNILIGKTFYDEFSDKFIEGCIKTAEEMEQLKKRLEKLSIADRMKVYENEFPTQDDRDNLACFNFRKEYLSRIEKWKPVLTFNFYLLCFEDLQTKYTARDERRFNDCKAGDFKRCHRTLLAKVLNERYGLSISEYTGKSEQLNLL